ncbi:MAG: hypothetical protein AABY32_04470, partial [Nanoarchaeota archaeon]
MKREVMFVFVFIFLLLSISLIYASEQPDKVEKAYACLENKLTKVLNCSLTSMSFDERVFSLLATGLCEKNVSVDNNTIPATSTNPANVCWSKKEGCTVKSTAQAILALNEKVDTTDAEKWLLRQVTTPTNMDWFLEIESSKAVTCKIGYQEKPYTFSIGADKKISSSDLGNCLALSTGDYMDYFLLISPSCYNMKFDISCNGDFITALLFKKQGSDSNPLNVLEGSSASTGGTTTQKVDSLCFSESGECKYEGRLLATFVL